MTKEEPNRETTDINSTIDKLTELIELQKQTNYLLTQQGQDISNICTALGKMNQNSADSALTMERLTRVVAMYTVLALGISLMNIFIVLSLNEGQHLLSAIIGFISSALVVYGLFYSLPIIKEANNEIRTLKK